MVKKRCDPASPTGARERAPRDRKLSKAISDLGWRQFRTLTEAKCEKYGREFRVISRWEPTSQKCSCCGFRVGKKELNVRQWTCLNCGAFHDRDVNAAINILEVVQPKTKVETTTKLENPVQLSFFNVVAEGQRSIIYRTRSSRKTRRKKQASSNDVSTRPSSPIQLRLFD